MRQSFLIARHEYIKYITRRGFLLSVLLFPLWIVLAATVPTLFQKAAPARNFIVLDHEGGYGVVLVRGAERAAARNTLLDLAVFAQRWHVDLAKLKAAAPDVAAMIASPERESSLKIFLARGGLDPVFRVITPYLGPGWTAFTPRKAPFNLASTPDDFAASKDVTALAALYFKGEHTVDGGRLESVLVIPKGFDGGAVPAQYLTANMEDNLLPNFIRQTLTAELRLRAVSRLVPSSMAAESAMSLSADLDQSDPTRMNTSAGAEIIGRLLPIALAFLLFFSTFTNATALLTGVIEEKSTRMVEILMSCASPREIMTGKLIGAIGASMTTLLIWGLGLSAAALALAPKDLVQVAIMGAHELLRVENLPFILIYFACGLLIYGAIYLAIGSMAASITDAQALLGPASLIIFLPNLLVSVILADPNGAVARIVSWIPIYTPFYMLMRLSAHPAPWEVWGTCALTLATTVLILFRMSRVFANHLLTTERPPAFGSLLRGIAAQLGGRTRAKSA
ncbi:MAG TPA: ABC transporter permease [Alphaproteobacteria bacterium]|nr:ABC transporter permease [Alphaproteobacteria bacterium]